MAIPAVTIHLVQTALDEAPGGRVVFGTDHASPAIAVLRIPAHGTIVAVHCDNEKRKEFQIASTCLGFWLGPDEAAETVHDSGSEDHRQRDTAIVEAIRTTLQKMKEAGYAWASDYWQLLRAPCGTMAVGLGRNLKNGKGARPRAGKIALALSLSLKAPLGTIDLGPSFGSLETRAVALLAEVAGRGKKRRRARKVRVKQEGDGSSQKRKRKKACDRVAVKTE